jgi:hypothetical protein
MEVSQEELERLLMVLMLQGDHPVLDVLRQQYAVATISARDFSGAGFFTSFDVPDDVPLTNPQNFDAGGMLISLENLPYGADCMIFVKNGKLDFLECYTFVDPWPKRIVIKSLSHVRPAIPDKFP